MGINKSRQRKHSTMGKKGKTTENTNQKLSLAIKSGKHKVGFKAVMKMLRNGQSKLVIINNSPAIRKTQLEYMAILGGSKVLHFDGNNVELGTASSRLHRVCVLAIQDPGDSDILTAVVN